LKNRFESHADEYERNEPSNNSIITSADIMQNGQVIGKITPVSVNNPIVPLTSGTEPSTLPTYTEQNDISAYEMGFGITTEQASHGENGEIISYLRESNEKNITSTTNFCPICSLEFTSNDNREINQHIDECLSLSSIKYNIPVGNSNNNNNNSNNNNNAIHVVNNEHQKKICNLESENASLKNQVVQLISENQLALYELTKAKKVLSQVVTTTEGNPTTTESTKGENASTLETTENITKTGTTTETTNNNKHILDDLDVLFEQKLYCNICWVNEKDIVLMGCGHFCLCEKCSINLNDCPICRMQITQKIKTYSS